MQQTLETISAGLIRQLKEQRSHDETILNYQIVCNSLIGFCNQHESSKYYSSKLLHQYLEYTELCLQNGEISEGYAQFKKRIIGLLEEYAETGSANLSNIQRKKLWLQSSVGVIIVTEQANSCATSTNWLHVIC
jgi:hypothetical protein